MHLIDGIIRRHIYSTRILAGYPIFRIEKISHLHIFLQIILGKLQHYIRFLRNSWYYQILHSNTIVGLLRTFRIIYQFGKFHPIFSKENTRMLSLTQLPGKQTIQLHSVAMFHIIQIQLLLYYVAHLYETPYFIKRSDVLRLQPIDAFVQRISLAEQIPSSINLTISRSFLKNHTFLIQPLETPDGSEERIFP